MTYCGQDNLCYIVVEITFISPLVDNAKLSGIEMNIRKIKNTPSYLKKNENIIDFLCGDTIYYLYTEVGKNEIGEVSINLFRDFANIWGRIVRKTRTAIDEEANWRGIYRMPSEDWEDSLPYDKYNNKLEIRIDDASDCIEGCYLLLSIQISQIGDYVDNKIYPFSIIANIRNRNYTFTESPKISIKVDEYIIGSVDLSENERINQFYEIWLPYDTYRVEFELQSSVAELYINLGGKKPTTQNADFKLLPHGRHSILYLDKTEIIDKAKSKKITLPYENSIEDLNLVIGIWSNKIESKDNEIFSLRVHEPFSKANTMNIIEVKTDHKILCNPLYLNENKYLCLFMIIYDEEDLGLPLVIHADSLNKIALTNISANFIEKKYYDNYNHDYLDKNIPTNDFSQYRTTENSKNYFYINLNTENKNYYLYVSVMTDKPDDIMLLTSIPTYKTFNSNYYQYYLSPGTEKLLISFDKLRLKLLNTSPLMVNIVCLDGEAELSWSDDPNNIYNLKGRDNRLSLITRKNVDELIISKKNISNNEFIFYISYFTRNSVVNFDKVQYGKSMEIAYMNTTLPIYLFSVIGDINNDINIAVSFKDLDNDIKGEYKNKSLFIGAGLEEENNIYEIKQNPKLIPSIENSFVGKYDPVLKTAHVFISYEDIKSLNILSEDNPTLFFNIEKNNNIN